MKDPERLVTAGTERERALLARAMARPVVPPAEIQLHVRQSVEQRLFRPASRPRIAGIGLALGAMLLAGSALGYGLVRLRAAMTAMTAVPPRPAPPASPSAFVPGPGPDALPAPPPIENRGRPASGGARRPASRERAVAIRARPPLSPPPLGVPALAGPWDFGSISADDERLDPGDLGPRPGSPRLTIVREGRAEISLVLAGNKVAGKIGDTLVGLTVERRHIVGKLGHLNVWVSLRGSRAAGTVGDRPIRFELMDTPDGHLLRQGPFLTSSLSTENARVHLGARTLIWSPGCDLPLPRSGQDAYRGPCASGREAQVILPARWQALPILPRMILLSLFLPERVHERPQQATVGSPAAPSLRGR